MHFMCVYVCIYKKHTGGKANLWPLRPILLLI